MNPLFSFLLILFSNTSNQSPVRLEKKEENFMDRHYETILKFLFIVLILLCILLVGTVFVLFVIHGANITGTEANGFYYHLEDWV
jgi:hypothetical protein